MLPTAFLPETTTYPRICLEYHRSTSWRRRPVIHRLISPWLFSDQFLPSSQPDRFREICEGRLPHLVDWDLRRSTIRSVVWDLRRSETWPQSFSCFGARCQGRLPVCGQLTTDSGAGNCPKFALSGTLLVLHICTRTTSWNPSIVLLWTAGVIISCY